MVLKSLKKSDPWHVLLDYFTTRVGSDIWGLQNREKGQNIFRKKAISSTKQGRKKQIDGSAKGPCGHKTGQKVVFLSPCTTRPSIKNMKIIF